MPDHLWRFRRPFDGGVASPLLVVPIDCQLERDVALADVVSGKENETELEYVCVEILLHLYYSFVSFSSFAGINRGRRSSTALFTR